MTFTVAENACIYAQLRNALTLAEEKIEDAKHWADEFSNDEIAEAEAEAVMLRTLLDKLAA